MRECWINVYGSQRKTHCGPPHRTREYAVEMSEVVADRTGIRPFYRLHVRLKPDRLDGLEDMARQMMTSPNQVTAKHGAMRLRMIQAACAKGTC